MATFVNHFFGEFYNWAPKDIDYLRWSDRKALKQSKQDALANQDNNII